MDVLLQSVALTYVFNILGRQLPLSFLNGNDERQFESERLELAEDSTRVDRSAIIARERDLESPCRCAGTEFAVTVRLQQFSDEYAAAVVELVHGILRDEFGFSGASAEQTDLSDIRQHYGHGASNFWIALDGSRLVGTTGFVDLGSRQGLLRKMFVRADCRGSGVAFLLLDKVMKWATEHGFVEIYLGTNSNFHAAQRFYTKHGFAPVSPESLPDAVPRLNLRDRLYSRSL